MSRLQAVALQVSPLQQTLLERLVRRQTPDQRLAPRAALILALAADPPAEAGARRTPHRSPFRLNATPQAREAFPQEGGQVCGLYEGAGRLAGRGVHLVSPDEKPGLQALQGLHPALPMGPGAAQRREYEYKRH